MYAPTTNAEEPKVEQFYDDLQDLLELKPKKKKKCPFQYRGLECKSRKSRDTWHLTGAAESPCILDEGSGPWDEIEVRLVRNCSLPPGHGGDLLPTANKKLGS